MHKNYCENGSVRIVIFILIIILVVVVAFDFPIPFFNLDRRIDRLEDRILEKVDDRLQVFLNTTGQSEAQETVAFLENETTKYRAFVQEQWDRFIEILRITGVIAIAVVTFMELENRKKISDTFQKHYAGLVKNELAKYIGGEDRENYLKKCVEKEKYARSKKILFLLQKGKHQETKQEGEADGLIKIYEFFHDNGYQADKQEVNLSMKKQQLNKTLNGYDVVVYEVGQSEVGREDTYIRIADQCKDKHIIGILYCADGIEINPNAMKGAGYISTVNYSQTLFDRINSALEFPKM